MAGPRPSAETIFARIKKLSPTEALQLIEEARHASPNDPKLLCKSAQLLALSGQKEPALQRVAQCLDEHSNDPGTWTTAMIVYTQCDQQARALDVAREGLKCAPDAYVYNKAADVLSGHKYYVEAIEAATEGMKKYPRNWRLETTALKIFAAAGDKKRTLDLIAQLEKRPYRDNYMRATMANALLGYNEGKRAWDIIRHPIPKDVKGLTVHAQCALWVDDLSAAGQDLVALRGLAPDDSRTHQIEARVAYRNGDMKKALEAYNRYMNKADGPAPFDALLYISMTADNNPVSGILRSLFAQKPRGWVDSVVASIRQGHLAYAQIESASREDLARSNLLADGGVATRAPVNQVSKIAATPRDP